MEEQNYYSFTFKDEETWYLYIILNIYLASQIELLKSENTLKILKKQLTDSIKATDSMIEKMKLQFTDKEIKTLDKQSELIKGYIQQ